MRLEFVRSYDDPIADVWSALSDPDRTARWFGRWTGDPASGSVDVTMAAEEGAPSQAVAILVCDPPHRLVVETGSGDGVWRLDVTLSAQADETTLRFVQRLSEPYDASSIGPGWHFYLDRLGAVLNGRDVPDDFDAYYPALQADYDVPGSAPSDPG